MRFNRRPGTDGSGFRDAELEADCDRDVLAVDIVLETNRLNVF